MGIFGDFFDFDHDGKLDTWEKTAELLFLMDVIKEKNKKDAEDEKSEDNNDR